jgi:tetratricopeptide (TPR) repeat protein
MQVLHLDLRQLNDEQAELRYFFDNPNDYNERLLGLAEIQDLLQVAERDYYTNYPEQFDKTGLQLYDWLDGTERWLTAAINKHRRQGLVLAIATIGKLAHLPWEVLHDGKSFLVERINPAVVPVRWIPDDYYEDGQDAPANRALRVLFMAPSPENLIPVLDFEAEEGRILKATAKQPIELIVEESGCLEELDNLVASYDEAYFDVFHLTGHATIADDCPYFWTETETGEAYLASAAELAEKLEFRLPPLIFLSGCRTGEARKAGAIPSMAEQLLQQGARAVLGWGRPVLEQDATAAAAALYQSLASGYGLPQAVAKTYQALIKSRAEDWHLLRLYIAGELPGALVTPLKTLGRPLTPPSPSIGDITRAFDKDGRVRVCNPSGFVGRRRQLQHCLKALKYDPEKVGILIYGMGGLGKSTLAMRLSDRLPDYERIVWVGPIDEPGLVKRLSERFDDPSSQKNLQATEPELRFRLRKLFRQIDRTQYQSLLLVLDGFEANLESRQGTFILSAKATKVLEALVFAIQDTRAPDRVIITCRYDFDSPYLQSFYKQPLASLREADLEKKCNRLPAFSAQPQDSSIQERAKQLADGNPYLLEKLDKVLQDATADLEANFVQLREQVLAQILLTQLDRSLQKILELGLVFEIPVPRTVLQELCVSIPNVDSHIDHAIGLGLLEVSKDSFLRVPRILALQLSEDLKAVYSTAAKILYRLWQIKETPIFIEERWNEVHRLALLGNEEVIAAEISRVLSTIWNRQGHFRKAVSVCSQTLENMKNPSSQKVENLIALGNAYRNLAQYQQAIDCYEQALSITDDSDEKDPYHLEALLGNLSACYADIGQLSQAICCSQRALDIASSCGDRESEGRLLNNLGYYSTDLGQFRQALEYYQKAKEISVDQNNRELEGRCLNNLCELYGLIGQFRYAVQCGEQALVIQDDVQDLIGKGETLHTLAQIQIDLEKYDKAIEYAQIGVIIGKKIESPELQSDNYSAIACAYLGCAPNELSKAWVAVKAAQQFDVPLNNHYVSLLLGIIALKQQDTEDVAHEAFTIARKQASNLLNCSHQNYRALETQWLSLCGLALCGEIDCIPATISFYRQLREIIDREANESFFKRSIFLLSNLISMDHGNILVEVHREIMIGK